MPLTQIDGDVNLLDNLTYMQPRTEHDVAEVGYYKTSLENGIVAEMSASQHAGIMQYTFPEEGGRHVLVDLSHYLPAQGKESHWYSNARIERSEDGLQYSGYGVYRGGWALGAFRLTMLMFALTTKAAISTCTSADDSTRPHPSRSSSPGCIRIHTGRMLPT